MSRRRPQDKADALALGALTLLALCVFWPLLFGGKAYFLGDLELYFYPMSEFWHRELVEGRLPLWNPYILSGVSFCGNPQIGLLYPPSVLLAIFPTITAISLGIVVHLWGSAAVFFFWMRRGRLRLGAMASLLGAMCWMLGGVFVSKLQFPNMLAALAWMPAVLWATENLAQRPRVRTVAVLGTMLGLQLLAAHAQVSLYTLYLAFFYVLWIWKTAEKREALWEVDLGFLAACVLGVLVDAGQILPVLENVRGAERQVLSLETAPRFVLPPWAITNLFAPYLYGNPNNGTWTNHGGGNAWETACYLGVVPFVLSLLAWKRGRFWLAVAVASLLLALGPLGGLYWLAYSFLPGIARFHDAARFLMLAGVALPVLAALGLQKLREIPKFRSIVPFLLILSAVDLGLYARGFYPLRDKTNIAPPSQFVGAGDIFLKTNQGRVWCANRKTANGLLIHYNDYTLRTPAHEALFAPSPIPNQNIWHNVLEAGGYEPVAPASVIKRLKSLEIGEEATRFPPAYARRLGESNIRFVSIWRKKPLVYSKGLFEIYRGSQTIDGLRLFIYWNASCAPRAQWSENGSDWQYVIFGADNAGLIEIGTPDSVAHIKLADNMAPGWVANTEGKMLELKATAEGFRRVDLEPRNGKGVRLVRLAYVPSTWRFGVFLSLCALGFIVAVGVATRQK